MNRGWVIVSILGIGLSACSDGSPNSPGSTHLRIDMACSADSECPTGFACESETEHGVTKTFCESVDPVDPDDATCPAGFELEREDGQLTCEPHGGEDDHGNRGPGDGAGGSGDDDDHGAGAADDGADHEDGDDGAGGDDDGADDEGAAGAPGTGTEGAACTTDADCAAGLECEIEDENGVAMGMCQPHGGGH